VFVLCVIRGVGLPMASLTAVGRRTGEARVNLW